MISFKPLTIADKPVILPYTYASACNNCDLSFSNLCSWSFLYHTEYAVVDGFLLMRFLMGDRMAYLMPLGEGPLAPVLEQLIADSEVLGEPFLLQGVCPLYRRQIEEQLPGRFRFEVERDYADYIYAREDLAALAGKKYQPKRNHINQFKRNYPNYIYRPLTAADVPLCLRLETQWCRANNCREHRALQAERHMMAFALQHIEELDIVGGMLLVEGELVAFTFGSPINATTFDVCVEKANTGYEGAYTVINHEFVNHLPAQYLFINREEDLGLEGLRKAKLSYYPVELLDKQWAELLPAAPEDATRQDLRFQTRQLWELCFEDPRVFIDLYFREKYRSNRNEYLLREGKVVCALQKIPYSMTYGGRPVAASYVSGACTHPQWRKKGLMRELLLQTHRQMRAEGALFSFLIPANEDLFLYYEKSGYAPCFRFAWQTMAVTSLVEADCTAIQLTALDEESGSYLRGHMQDRLYAIQHSVDDFRVILEDARLAGDTLWELRRPNGIIAMAFSRAEADGVLLREWVADDATALQLLVNAIGAHFAQPQVDCLSVKADEGDFLGMARVLNVPELLQRYARLHPTETLHLQVTDPDLPENSGLYRMADGNVEHQLLPEDAAMGGVAPLVSSLPHYSVGALTRLLVTDQNPLMSLMLND